MLSLTCYAPSDATNDADVPDVCDCGTCRSCCAARLDADLRRSGYYLTGWERELLSGASETHLKWLYDHTRPASEVIAAYLAGGTPGTPTPCDHPTTEEWEAAEQARDAAEVDAAASVATIAKTPLAALLAESVRRKFAAKSVGIGRRLTPTSPVRVARTSTGGAR